MMNSSPGTVSFIRGSIPAWLAAIVLAILTLVVYSPLRHNGFIDLDDDDYIFANPRIRQGLTLDTARWALSTTEHANWSPVGRLSHLADVSLFGMRAGWHHLMSALWHASAASLLFVALLRMTAAFWCSLFTAALFALHPLQVEAVAWATERGMVLAGFFFALTLLLWGRYVARPGLGRYAAALTAFALGLATKPVLVTLPFVLLLLDFWPLGRFGGAAGGESSSHPGIVRLIVEKTPLFLLTAVSVAVTMLTQSSAGAMVALDTIPLGLRFGNAALSYVRYLGLLLWPVNLAVFYPHQMEDMSVAGVSSGVISCRP